MSQFDFGTIDPYVVDGVQLADMLNQWRDAIHSMHRGGTRPSYVVPGMMWINDSAGPTSWVVNVYFSPTVGDMPLFTYDTTTGNITISASSGGTFSAAVLLAQAAASPMVRWDATGNPIDQKDWRAWVTNNGGLHFGFFNDAGVEQTAAAVQFNPDGSNSIIPAGVIWDFGGGAAPTGWYLCDGSSRSTTTDANLFAAIAYKFGGSGASFNLPDLRGRVTAGPDSGGSNRLNTAITSSGTVGSAGGEQAHTLTNLESPPSLVSVAGNGPQVGAMNFGDGASPVFFTGPAAHNNTQPTLIVNKIIKR